jgi:hypothetical protein
MRSGKRSPLAPFEMHAEALMEPVPQLLGLRSKEGPIAPCAQRAELAARIATGDKA